MSLDERLSTPVRDVMTTTVASVPHDASLLEVARVLVEERVSGLPVLDEAGRVVGVVSLSDVTARLGVRPGERPPQPGDDDNVFYDAVDPGRILDWIHGEPDHPAGATRASEVMSRRLLSVGPTMTLREAARLMSERRVHRLLVLEGERRLAGILSTLDVVGFVAR